MVMPVQQACMFSAFRDAEVTVVSAYFSVLS